MRNMLLRLRIAGVREAVFWVDLVEELLGLGGRHGGRMRWRSACSRGYGSENGSRG